MVTTAEYLLMANDAYRKDDPDDPNELFPDSLLGYEWEDITSTIQPEPDVDYQYDFGFFARVYENSNTGELVIAYTGTNVSGGPGGDPDPGPEYRCPP